MKQIFVILFSSFLGLSCQNQTGSAWQTLTFIQNKPLLTHINLGDTAHEHGDGMAYEAELKDTAGTVVGEVLGWMVTVDIVDGDSANPVHITDRIGRMMIKLDEENTIIVSGGNSYKKGEYLTELGVFQKRAVVGGTGKYKGIKGEATISRNEDGTYKHVLDVKMSN